MRFYRGVALWALAAAACLTGQAFGGIHSLLRGSDEAPAQQPHPAIVRVEVVEPGTISHGSGTLIGSDASYGWVVTNWHVVRGAGTNVTVQFPGGFSSPATIAKTDENWDLALLVIHRPPVQPLPMAAYVPTPGEPLFIAGYGSGKFRLAPGECVGYAAPDAGFPQEMIDVSVPARKGDSGGPIVNSQGQVAGVLFGSGGGLTTGTHVGRLRQFLADISLGSATAPESMAKTEVAGQPMTSHRESVASLPKTNQQLSPPVTPQADQRVEQDLASMPTLTLQTPANTTESFDAQIAADPEERSQFATYPTSNLGTAEHTGYIPLLNPKGELGETGAFFAFLAVVGVILMLSPRGA